MEGRAKPQQRRRENTGKFRTGARTTRANYARSRYPAGLRETRRRSPWDQAPSWLKLARGGVPDRGSQEATNLQPLLLGRRSLTAAGNFSTGRSEERRVGEECRYRWSPY